MTIKGRLAKLEKGRGMTPGGPPRVTLSPDQLAFARGWFVNVRSGPHGSQTPERARVARKQVAALPAWRIEAEFLTAWKTAVLDAIQRSFQAVTITVEDQREMRKQIHDMGERLKSTPPEKTDTRGWLTRAISLTVLRHVWNGAPLNREAVDKLRALDLAGDVPDVPRWLDSALCYGTVAPAPLSRSKNSRELTAWLDSPL